MLSLRDNPLLYRSRRAGRGWQRLALAAVLPAIWLLPPLALTALTGNPALLEGRERAEMAQTSFAISAFAQLVWMVLRALAGTVGAFTGERERGALEALLASRLASADLLAGALASVARPLLRDMLLVAPLWLAWVAFGTASLGQALALQGLALVFTLFFAALGLWCSARERTTLASGQRAYGVLVLLAMLAPAADLLLDMSDLAEPPVLSVASPLMAEALVLWPRMADDAAGWLPAASALLFLFGSGALLALTARRLRHLDTGPAPGRSGAVAPSRPLLARLWDNPVWFRHLVGAPRRVRSRWLARVVWPALLVGPTALIWAANRLDWAGHRLQDAAETGFAVTAVAHVLYFSMRALSAGTAALSSEREARTLDPLLGTPEARRRLIPGFLATVLGLPLLEMLAWAPALLGFCMLGATSPERVAALVGFTAVCVVFFGMLGLWLGGRSATTHRAVGQGWAVLALLVLGTFLVDALLNSFMRVGDFFVLTRANPLMALATALWAEPDRAGALWAWCTTLYLSASVFLLRATARRIG